VNDQSSTTAERSRSGQSVANPRRLRLDSDGQPLPVPTATSDRAA
jgi:hypothetical protein